jgi:uncharacterized DUF497 family protein
MDEHILRSIQTKIRTLHYRMTVHAEEEMCDDSFSVFEVEQAILNGMITERQKDQNSGEWKYVIHGRTDRGELMAVVAKLSKTDVVIIITVYAC